MDWKTENEIIGLKRALDEASAYAAMAVERADKLAAMLNAVSTSHVLLVVDQGIWRDPSGVGPFGSAAEAAAYCRREYGVEPDEVPESAEAVEVLVLGLAAPLPDRGGGRSPDRSDVRAFPCPHCGAVAGEPCVSGGGRVSSELHSSRWDIAFNAFRSAVTQRPPSAPAVEDGDQ